MSELRNTLKDTATYLGDKVTSFREQAENCGIATGARIDEARNDVADGLHSTASSVRVSSRSALNTMEDCAVDTADKLDSTAVYVRGHDVQSMLGDCWKAVRRNPGPSLALALAAGFFAGAAIRRK